MHLLADFHISSLLPLCVILPVTVMMVLRVYRRLEPRRKSAVPARVQERQKRLLESRTLGEQSPTQLAQWEVQMHETARELSARLDNKMRSLNHLIAVANSASDRLEHLQAKSASSTNDSPMDAKVAEPEAVPQGR